ncbi:MAG TPA: helix-turn-helix domain-containing protein [Casimicrobiaceae bacterium]|nr:helix-turn-helix domain-containing protein [Casimicrobiaceae bacterium]
MATQRRIAAARIRELRIELEMSVRELANKAKVDPHTITDWENGRTELAQVAKIKDVASALDVEWTELILEEAAPKARIATPTEVAVVSTAESRAQARRRIEWDDSVIEHKVNVEAKNGLDRAAPDQWEDGRFPALTARQLWNIHSSRLVHENERWSVNGVLAKQKRMNPVEETLLGCSGFGTRFLLERGIGHCEEHGDETLDLTLLSVRLQHTHSLQQFLGQPVQLLVRVIVRVQNKDTGKLEITDLDGGPRRLSPSDFPGFFVFGQTKCAEWTLVVERIMLASVDQS